jgi:hypothetical protein
VVTVCSVHDELACLSMWRTLAENGGMKLFSGGEKETEIPASISAGSADILPSTAGNWGKERLQLRSCSHDVVEYRSCDMIGRIHLPDVTFARSTSAVEE